MQVTDTPGSIVAGGQTGTGAVPVPLNAVSVTVGSVRVTFPVLVTRKEYVTVWPAAVMVVGVADFTTVIAGLSGAGMVTVDGGDTTGGPEGGLPVVVAVFVMLPASTSAWVSV